MEEGAVTEDNLVLPSSISSLVSEVLMFLTCIRFS